MLISLLAVSGCVDDTSDEGNWEPTTSTWWTQDTSPRTLTGDSGPTDTAPPIPTADTGPTTDGSCTGKGPLSLVLGEGGSLVGFQAFGVGADLPIVTGTDSGLLGVTMDVLTTGLDTTSFVNAVMRITTPQTDTTYIGTLSLQCPFPGPGWMSIHADFKNSDQSAAAAGQFDGDPITVDLTVTDRWNVSAETEFDLILRGP